MEQMLIDECADGKEIAVSFIEERMKEVMSGLKHLHSKGISHGDIQGFYNTIIQILRVEAVQCSRQVKRVLNFTIVSSMQCY